MQGLASHLSGTPLERILRGRRKKLCIYSGEYHYHYLSIVIVNRCYYEPNRRLPPSNIRVYDCILLILRLRVPQFLSATKWPFP